MTQSIYNYLINVSLTDTKAVEDAKKMEDYLIGIAKDLNLVVLGKQSHKFKPIGFTSLLLLSESHISIHTWPEHSLACIDILTCSGSLDLKRLTNVITSPSLKLKVTSIKEVLTHS
jgi:S-adenosylmethionine decarboxylase proenzyme